MEPSFAGGLLELSEPIKFRGRILVEDLILTAARQQ